MGKVLIWFVIIISTVVLYCLMKVKAESDELYEELMRKHFYGRSDDIPASDTSITYDTYSQTSDVAADIWSQQDKTIKLVVIMIWETPAISVI